MGIDQELNCKDSDINPKQQTKHTRTDHKRNVQLDIEDFLPAFGYHFNKSNCKINTTQRVIVIRVGECQNGKCKYINQYEN